MKRSLSTPTGVSSLVLSAGLLLFLAASSALSPARAAVPPAEKLLPADTLAMVTTPDYTHLKQWGTNLPQARLWQDPAMKPFRDKFMGRWQSEVLEPLQRNLHVNLDDYTALLQGQVTVAVLQNGWQGDDQSSAPGLVLLVDSKSKSGQLKKDLAELHKKWVDAGKVLRSEKIQAVDFTVLTISSNDIPKSLRPLQPQSRSSNADKTETDDATTAKNAEPKMELFVGQADSLLIVANSSKTAEAILTRLSGSSAPVLGEQALYQSYAQGAFRTASCYGWVNTKTFLDIFLRKLNEIHQNSDSPNALTAIGPERIFTSLGLTGIKTAAFSLQDCPDGTLCQFTLGVPESSRQGLLKILAGEAKDVQTPVFVPATAVKFQRWRIDGQKSWTALEQMCNDISPQWGSTLNFLLDTAGAAAREKDPDFSVRKNLIGNLGDDFITYEKASQPTLASLQSPPSLMLIGSPNPEQLTAAIKSLFTFLSQQAGGPTEREFLGHKIVTVPLPELPLPGTSMSRAPHSQSLSFAATSGYLVLAQDASMIEEYLCSNDSSAKSLRESSGLAQAAQRVNGPGTSLFGYENQAVALRPFLEYLSSSANASTNSAESGNLAALNALLGNTLPTQKLAAWVDLSLLPNYDKISKYFYINVYSGSANAEGLTLKTFAPVPPQLNLSQPAKP